MIKNSHSAPSKLRREDTEATNDVVDEISDFSNFSGQEVGFPQAGLGGLEDQVGHAPERLPLRRKLPPPDPFPVAVLGDVLAPAVKSIVSVIQCPEALAAQSVLAAATLAVQGHADLSIDGRQFPISNNFISIAESGERKSAADRAALRPHHDRQKRQNKEHEKALERYEIEHAAWEKEKTQILSDKNNKGVDKKAQALDSLGPKPKRPIDVIQTTEEPTYEGLVKALLIGWPSMGLFSDEGGRFLGGHGMNQDNQLKTATGLSKLWDGDPISRTRGGDGNLLIYGKRVSVHLMIQPEVSDLLFGNRLLIRQGLMSRCLIAYPESQIGKGCTSRRTCKMSRQWFATAKSWRRF